MRKNYLIGHGDIAGVGYYFLDPKQEERYLECINDELAVRVGMEVCSLLPPEQQVEINSLGFNELYVYLKSYLPNIDEMLSRVRTDYLEEIREKRKSYLMEEQYHEDQN